MNFSGSMSMRRSYERILSAGLIRMNLMHTGREDFLVQGNTFKGRKNLGPNSVGAWKPVRASPSGSTQSSNEVGQRLTTFGYVQREHNSNIVRTSLTVFQLFKLLCPMPRPTFVAVV